jgi:hypothetical protein
MKDKLIYILISLFFLSCNSHTIDKVISEIDSTDISPINGMSICYRSKAYYINTCFANCSPYIIETNHIEIDSLEINNNLVLKSCGRDYLDYSQIKKAFQCYNNLQVCYIRIDEKGNVYINPSKADYPTLLRISENNTPKDIKNFEKYKGNWYIRK